MLRITINEHHGRVQPSVSVSIHEGQDALVSSFALISAPVTHELVDALRTAARHASEALESYEQDHA